MGGISEDISFPRSGSWVLPMYFANWGAAPLKVQDRFIQNQHKDVHKYVKYRFVGLRSSIFIAAYSTWLLFSQNDILQTSTMAIPSEALQVVAVSLTALTLSIIATGLRIWSRRLQKVPLAFNDYMVFVGLVLTIGSLSSTISGKWTTHTTSSRTVFNWTSANNPS